jgi:hypothetical protein
MASDDRESVALDPDVIAALDELARVYTSGDREAMVRFAIHRFQDAHFDEVEGRMAAEEPSFGDRELPVFGDPEPERPPGAPMVVTMAELQRLREIFGKYPDGPVEIREEGDRNHGR